MTNPFLSQAEEGVAEEAVLGEGGHPDHLPRHGEPAARPRAPSDPNEPIKGRTSPGEFVCQAISNLEASWLSRIDIDGVVMATAPPSLCSPLTHLELFVFSITRMVRSVRLPCSAALRSHRRHRAAPPHHSLTQTEQPGLSAVGKSNLAI